MAKKKDTSDIKKERVLKALAENRAFVATACKEAQIARSTFYVWLEIDSDFAEAVQDIEEAVFDGVENVLHNMIEEKNTAATIFYSKTKMKSRGYVERNEITGADGEPVKAQIYLPDNGRPVDES